MEKIEPLGSAWDAVTDSVAKAANLQIRAKLMLSITQIIRDNAWKQADAAIHCGVTKPRLDELLDGRVSRFSLDSLVNIVSALGYQVQIHVTKLEAEAA